MNTKEYNSSVQLYSDSIFRFILKNIRDEEKAKDIVQDTYLKLWQKVETVDFEKSKAYLFTVAYRTMIDLIRREKKQGKWSDIYEQTEYKSSNYTGINEILHEALLMLPEAQRSAVLLRDYEGYDYKEIGEIMNLNLAQVKVYIFRARKKLKEFLVSIETII